MRINHNIASLNTYRQLTINGGNTNKALEKLASGLRINKAGDDAAGLAISEKMRAQIRGLETASNNAQVGISLIQTAEGALSETHSILQRMRELATQAASDTNVDVDRTEIQKEINQLSSELNRIGNTTEFNTKKMLNGGGTDLKVDSATLLRGGAVGTVSSFATVVSSVAEVIGENELTITTAFDVGETITVFGQTFTAVSGNADASLGQFAGGDATSQAASLAAAINANDTLHSRFSDATAAAGVISFDERAGKAEGTNISANFTVNATTGAVTANDEAASIKEVQGRYTFDVATAFEVAGQTLTIGPGAGAITYTAVSNNADPTQGQFNITSDREAQAAAIAAAINAEDTHYQATVKGTTIIMTERAGEADGPGAGVELASTDITPGAATAVEGNYSATFGTLVNNGGKISIDGVDIKVVDDADKYASEIASGTAMMAGDDFVEQVNNLSVAINSNSALNSTYTAGVAGEMLTLDQKTGFESITAPTVSASSDAIGQFEATLQIGANSGQSVTVTIEDMRSLALGVTGTDAGGSVTAKNGDVAEYARALNVTNGSTNTNVEYALDVSSYARATNAVSVINDAIEKVSGERSKLGAFQNRLEHTIANLGTAAENLTSAESRIRDVDMAKEMMEFTKNNILSQAAQSMLAQANQQPQGVLQLLR